MVHLGVNIDHVATLRQARRTYEPDPVWAAALAELRRVAAKRLIVVLPKERPYRYTFNLHLHFFPYRYQVTQLFDRKGPGPACDVRELAGCWFCQEEMGEEC